MGLTYPPLRYQKGFHCGAEMSPNTHRLSLGRLRYLFPRKPLTPSPRGVFVQPLSNVCGSSTSSRKPSWSPHPNQPLHPGLWWCLLLSATAELGASSPRYLRPKICRSPTSSLLWYCGGGGGGDGGGTVLRKQGKEPVTELSLCPHAKRLSDPSRVPHPQRETRRIIPLPSQAPG